MLINIRSEFRDNPLNDLLKRVTLKMLLSGFILFSCIFFVVDYPWYDWKPPHLVHWLFLPSVEKPQNHYILIGTVVFSRSSTYFGRSGSFNVSCLKNTFEVP